MKVIYRTKAVTQRFLENSFKKLSVKKENKKNKNPKNTKKLVFSKCMLRRGVVRVFVSFLVLVFVRAILSWCP